MYGSVQQSGRRTRAIGLVTATALTVGFGYVLAEGMNLEGIRRVMELEAEVERLRAENAELRERMSIVEADASRRAPRRDLVPLRQTVAIFGGPRLGERR